jgi:hypothetical protein
MRKRIILLAMTLTFVTGFAADSFAGGCKGWVKAVNGTTVTVVCADGAEIKAEGSAKIGVGHSVEVRGGKIVAAKYRVIEDC